MSNTLIPFGGNTTTAVVRQGKYRVVHHRGGFAIEVVIETPDDRRAYPTSREHPELVAMVNRIKQAGDGQGGGQFYINEYCQVIVPAGNPVTYYYAGEYHQQIILALDGEEFSGRPHDEGGNLLAPGNTWSGRPRPGIGYKLKAGGGDIEYTVAIGPGRERIIKLSKIVGQGPARKTARKIAQIKGNLGGRFYVNEYRSIFGPKGDEDGYQYIFIGVLTDQDAWFPKWNPAGNVPATELPSANPPPVRRTAPFPAAPEVLSPRLIEKKIEIADGEKGHSWESLFSDYMRNVKTVIIEDPYLKVQHQIGNLLRLCEMLVKIGHIKEIRVITGDITDESRGRLESILLSLKGFGIVFTYSSSRTLHDRKIITDTGWEICLGRGLDIYRKPDDYCSVGATDFSLRPCYPTYISYHKTN